MQNEADFYRSSDAAGDRQAEAPVDDYHHALTALRYLVSRLERWRGPGPGNEAA